MLGIRLDEKSLNLKQCVFDTLNRADNFSPWKERFVLVLQEFELWDIVENTIVPTTDPVQSVDFNKMNVKAKRPLLDVVKGHLISRVSGKTYAFQV